jgi:hypothetical protein
MVEVKAKMLRGYTSVDINGRAAILRPGGSHHCPAAHVCMHYKPRRALGIVARQDPRTSSVAVQDLSATILGIREAYARAYDVSEKEETRVMNR